MSKRRNLDPANSDKDALTYLFSQVRDRSIIGRATVYYQRLLARLEESGKGSEEIEKAQKENAALRDKLAEVELELLEAKEKLAAAEKESKPAPKKTTRRSSSKKTEGKDDKSDESKGDEDLA